MVKARRRGRGCCARGVWMRRSVGRVKLGRARTAQDRRVRARREDIVVVGGGEVEVRFRVGGGDDAGESLAAHERR